MDYEFYNKHYLKTREDGAIVDAWSDGPFAGRSTEGYICFDEKGQYQLRLTVDGAQSEENPPIVESNGVPLYKWDGEKILRRSGEEIQADIDQIPPPPPSQMEQMRADIDFIMVMDDLM